MCHDGAAGDKMDLGLLESRAASGGRCSLVGFSVSRPAGPSGPVRRALPQQRWRNSPAKPLGAAFHAQLMAIHAERITDLVNAWLQHWQDSCDSARVRMSTSARQQSE
eukprot:g47615.t1